MYTQNNTNQPQSVQASSTQQYMPNPAMQPFQVENNSNSLYIPAPMPHMHLQHQFETEMFNTPSCMRTLIERYIGKIVRAQFLIGDVLHDHVGRLMSVGPTYLVIESLSPRNGDKDRVITICDLFSLKFVTVIFDENEMEM